MTRPLLALALALAACNTGFDPQYRVQDLRILGVRHHVEGSTAADASPGDTLVLEALVANPLGRAGVEISWVGCLPGPSEALPPCADPEVLKDPVRLATAPGVVALGTGAAPPPLPLPDLSAALEFVVGRASREPTWECSLYAELVVVVIATAPGARPAIALKRVRIEPSAAQVAAGGATDRYDRNLNPAIADVRSAVTDPDACAGGGSVAVAPVPAGRTTLCGRAAPDAVQAYTVCAPDGTYPRDPEVLDWQWYVTAGEFPEESGGVGDARGETVELERAPGPFTLWVVLGDGRGGEDWATFAVSSL